MKIGLSHSHLLRPKFLCILFLGTELFYCICESLAPSELCCARPEASLHCLLYPWCFLDKINFSLLGEQGAIHLSYTQPLVTAILCDDGSLTQHHLYSFRLADVLYQPVDVPALIF